MEKQPLRADGRIKLIIGSQFVEIQALQDQVADLTDQLAAAVAKIGALEAPAPAEPVKPV